MLEASIDIAAPPEVVRAKFLDFANLRNYHQGFFESITPANRSDSIKVGDKFNIVLESGQSFASTVTDNTSTLFSWGASLPVILTASHAFKFESSTTIQGGTKFTQEENFTGALGFLMGDGALSRAIGMKKKTKAGWEKYNRDLKEACEGGK